MTLVAKNLDFKSRKPDGKKVEVKTYGYGGYMRSLIEIGDHTLSREDFCAIVEYFLTNTSLQGKDDPRLSLVRRIKAMRQIKRTDTWVGRKAFKSTYLAIPKKKATRNKK